MSRSALTGGNSTDEREFTVTVTPNTKLNDITTYLKTLFEPIGATAKQWWS
ncbi:MAG: hypothetical protein QE263_07665 [Vampirovibrionales bacterium]|nr:hypothetical protein [Vampirovibrionales bacterium]